MNLKTLLSGLDNLKAKGDLDIDITSVEYDSRKVKEGSLFVAIKGFNVDGHEYIKSAVDNGAKAILIEEGAKIKKTDIKDDTTVILSPDNRIALAQISKNFYKNPASKFKLIGITGTKGKTTTSFMIKQILEQAGHKVGLIGTIANYINDEKIGDNNSRTTPESLELNKLFSYMLDQKVDTVVMEVSSQSLKYKRVYGLEFDIGIFTNFSEDHIGANEHPDMEDYFNSKLELIKMSKECLINSDDFHVRKIKTLFPDKNIKTYGIDNEANLLAKDVTVTNSGVDFRAKIGQKNERIKVGIPGRFTVYNALAAIGVANIFSVDAENLKAALENIAVPGRSELVPNKKDLTIMIDYAHSPASLESILKAVKGYTRGRVISVFGCGGDRDKTKRPIMGKISGEIAGFTIITTDNPRTENPEKIVKDIEEGIKQTKGQYTVIVDRTEAIKQAIKMANKNDIIVLTGKGHETYQEINGEKLPYDERKIIKQIIG